MVQLGILDLISRIVQDSIEIRDTHFHSLAQTTAWIKNEFPSNASFIFQDDITLLDLIGTSNLSNDCLLDGQYKDSRANFVNNSATRCTASFGRELPALFGRIEPSSVGGQLALTNP